MRDTKATCASFKGTFNKLCVVLSVPLVWLDIHMILQALCITESGELKGKVLAHEDGHLFFASPYSISICCWIAYYFQ